MAFTHRKDHDDYLQGSDSEIPAVISESPSRLRVVPIISTSPEPMVTARLEQMATLSPRRLAEQPFKLRFVTLARAGPGAAAPLPGRYSARALHNGPEWNFRKQRF